MSGGVHLGSASIWFAWSKWDGGATGTGRYHVWAMCKAHDFRSGLVNFSQQAVVDDFGNLVAVPS